MSPLVTTNRQGRELVIVLLELPDCGSAHKRKVPLDFFICPNWTSHF
jgi:hypothetical protein